MVLRTFSKSAMNKFLLENHKFKCSDDVIVYNRTYHDIQYNGKIFSIVRKPVNPHLNPFRNEVDYFYIKFSKDVYNNLLQRGWEIIYNNQPAIIGNVVRNNNTNDIEQLYIQYPYPMMSKKEEIEIQLENINAILMWRIAYEIREIGNSAFLENPPENIYLSKL